MVCLPQHTRFNLETAISSSLYFIFFSLSVARKRSWRCRSRSFLPRRSTPFQILLGTGFSAQWFITDRPGRRVRRRRPSLLARARAIRRDSVLVGNFEIPNLRTSIHIVEFLDYDSGLALRITFRRFPRVIRLIPLYVPTIGARGLLAEPSEPPRTQLDSESDTCIIISDEESSNGDASIYIEEGPVGLPAVSYADAATVAATFDEHCNGRSIGQAPPLPDPQPESQVYYPQPQRIRVGGRRHPMVLGRRTSVCSCDGARPNILAG